MTRVAVVTPGTGMRAEYVESLLATGRAFAEVGIEWEWWNGQSSDVRLARELALAGGNVEHTRDPRWRGEGRADVVLWIDSDMSWEADDALKLVGSVGAERPMVSGLYALDEGLGLAVAIERWQRPDPMHFMFDEFIEVWGVGLGLCAMEYAVAEELERPWFRTVTSGALTLGEDYGLCERVRTELGGSVWVMGEVRPRHWKTVGIRVV